MVDVYIGGPAPLIDGEMNGSEKHDAPILDDTVGIFVQGSVVDERHVVTRRYPQPLVPVRRVRVDSFTIALDLELSRKPEASAIGRRLFEQIRDAIESIIAGRDLRDAPIGSRKDDKPHEGTPLRVGPVLVTPDVPTTTIGATPDARPSEGRRESDLADRSNTVGQALADPEDA